MALLFISCAPQKRINRIVKNNPHLLQKDTVKVTDTFKVIVPGTKKDSLISINDLRKDTIYIRKDHMTIKTIIKNDTLYVHGECDTLIKEIVREVSLPYEKIVAHKPRDKLSWDDLPSILRIFYFFCSFIGIMLIIRLFKK